METDNYTPLDLDKQNKKSKGWLLFTIFVLLALIIGLAFFMIIRYQRASQSQVEENFVVPTIAPEPTPELEEEVESIDVGTDEAEFEQIQQDVDQL